MGSTWRGRIEHFTMVLTTSCGIVKPGEMRGCQQEELERLCMQRGLPHLPAAYEEFLKLAGVDAGRFWRGSDAFYPELLDLDESYVYALAEDMGAHLPDHGKLVFFSHQGYQYQWLDLSQNVEDPPVWELLEEPDGQPRRVADSFTELICRDVDYLAANSCRARPT